MAPRNRTFTGKPITRPPAPMPPAPSPPVNLIPSTAQSTTLNKPLQFSLLNGNAVQIQDNDSLSVTATLKSTNGTIKVTDNSGAVVTGDLTQQVSISGSPAAVNRALNGMYFVPYLDVSGTAVISMQVNDGTTFDLDTFNVTVSGTAAPPPSGQAPINYVPPTQSIVAPATSLTFNSTNSNLFTVADADTAVITTTIKVTNGKFRVTNLASGATLFNNDTGSVGITGTPAQINAAINGSTYTPTSGFTGVVTVTVETRDGAFTDTDSFIVTVGSDVVAPPPSGPTSPPYYPFGSRLDLVSGKYPYGIQVSNVSNASMDSNLRNKFNEWKAARIRNVASVPGAKAVTMANVNYPNTSAALCVSEGIGYGMLITVIFEDQATFDGLLTLVRARPAVSIPNGYANANLYLMDWKLDAYGNTNYDGNHGGGWNAMDGDMDIAQALLMAHRQWGTSGTTWNYMLEAQRIIAAMKAWNFHPNGHTKGMATGDVSRTSDYMWGHFRSYAVAMNDTYWTNTVIPRCKAIIEKCQTQFSAANGGPGCWVPDFVVNTDGSMSGKTYGVNHQNQMAGNVTNFAQAFNLPGSTYGSGFDNYVPSPGNRGDWVPTEMHYYANGQRMPQRWGNDYIYSGDADVKTQTNRMMNYVKADTNNNPEAVPIGYRLNAGLQGPQGGPINMGTPYTARLMVCGFSCGAQVDVAHQNWLNSCWNYQQNFWTTNYYDSELMLLAQVAMSGNWWTYPGNPQNTTLVNGKPTAQSTPTNTARVFSAANGNQLSLSYSGNVTQLTTNISVSSGTVSLTTGGGGTLTGNGTGAAQIVGTLAQVNAALATVTFVPANAFTGTVTMTMFSTDGTASDTDTISIVVSTAAPPPPAPDPEDTGEDVLTTYFVTNGVQGTWLDPTPITRFESLATGGTVLTAYGQETGKWLDRSGRGNHFTEPDINSRPHPRNDGGRPARLNIYHGGPIANVGGSTTDLYICVGVDLADTAYMGTILSSENGMGGIRLYHNADESGQATWPGAPAPLGDIIFEVGNGTSRVQARRFSMGTNGTSAGSPPPYTVFSGARVIEAWVTGGNVNLRINKGATHTVALGSPTIAAGTVNMMFGSRNTANEDWVDQDSHQIIVMKGVVPSAAERDLIASWVGTRSGLSLGTGLPSNPYPNGQFTETMTLASTQFTVRMYRPSIGAVNGILLIFHGTNRNASDYRTWAQPLADKYGFIVACPLFETVNYSSTQYNRANVLPNTDPSTWNTRFVPPLIDQISIREGMTLPVYLFGFSAGGQYLARVAAFEPLTNRVQKIVSGGASTYVRPLLGAYPSGEEAPYGMGGLTAQGIDQVDVDAYLQRAYGILIGSLDNDPNDPNLTGGDAANRQGSNRLARAQFIYAEGQAQATARNVTLGWTYIEVPSVAHDAQTVLLSPQCQTALGLSNPTQL